MSRRSGHRFSEKDRRNSRKLQRIPIRSEALRRACAARNQDRAKKKPGKQAGLSHQGRFNWKSESRHHALEPEQMRERLELTPLLVAEAHDQREARRLEAVDVDLAHVDGGHAS